jgi:hypothetical protein
VATAEVVKRPGIGAEGERTRGLEKTELGASEEERLFEALLRVRAKKCKKKASNLALSPHLFSKNLLK